MTQAIYMTYRNRQVDIHCAKKQSFVHFSRHDAQIHAT